MGLGQLVTGRSVGPDRPQTVDRRRHAHPGRGDRLIAATTGFWAWAIGAALLGAGTAMVYPTLLAAIGDVAHPLWRARSVGIYRLWRDAGFAVGALLAGILADLISIEAAIYAVAASLQPPASSSSFACTRPTHRPLSGSDPP